MTTPEIIFLSAASPFIITLVILSVCMIARWINIRDLILTQPNKLMGYVLSALIGGFIGSLIKKVVK